MLGWYVCIALFFLFSRFHSFSLQRLCLTPLLRVSKSECSVYENTQSYTCTHAAVSFALLALWMIYIQLLLCWVMVVREWMNMLIMLSLGYRLGAYYRDCDVLFVFVFFLLFLKSMQCRWSFSLIIRSFPSSQNPSERMTPARERTWGEPDIQKYKHNPQLMFLWCLL